MFADGVSDVVLRSMSQEDARVTFVCVSQENGVKIDLNVEAQGGEGE